MEMLVPEENGLLAFGFTDTVKQGKSATGAVLGIEMLGNTTGVYPLEATNTLLVLGQPKHLQMFPSSL